MLALLIPPSEPQTFKLATFNIHHAEGVDGKLDLDRVASVVRGSDIIAFQEVDVHFGDRSANEDQAKALAKRLDAQVAFGGNLKKGEGLYGVALVSKYPITRSQNHPLPRSPGRDKAEPRGLLEATLDVHGKPLRVYVTHLAHDSKADRALQVEAIRKIVSSGEGPYILMGDLNQRPDDPNHAKLLAPLNEGGSPLFVDAWAKVGKGEGHSIGLEGTHSGRIDYILASPDLGTGFTSARVDVETKASDHQPVFAELRR